MTLQRDPLRFAWRATLDEAIVPRDCARGYVYSVEDEVVDWTDVERHAELAEGNGWRVRMLRSSGSGHMGHAKAMGKRYWDFIRGIWEERVEDGVEK